MKTISKYTDSLIKGNETLTNKVKQLENEIEQLHKDKEKLRKENFELKQENRKLKLGYCGDKGNCKLLNNKMSNMMKMVLQNMDMEGFINE